MFEQTRQIESAMFKRFSRKVHCTTIRNI